MKKKKKNKKNNFIKKVVHINKVSKTIKGRRIMAFTALIVIGNFKGKIGYANAKSKDVNSAINKALIKAYKNIVNVNLKKGTIYHKIISKFCSSKIIMIPTFKSVGIIAGGAMRPVLSLVGINNIIAKSYGSRNPFNILKATINGLLNIKTNNFFLKKKMIHY